MPTDHYPMNVLVAVKESAVVSDTFEISDGRIPDQSLEYELNEWDEYALEAAVQLVEEGSAESVTTVTIGPPRSEETIRKALAKGADRAIRIWDPSLENRDYLDSSAKATLLKAIIDRETPELVLTGVQSDDDMFGATGVALAARAGYSWAAVVNQLSVDEQTISVRRELEGGVEELATIELPALCTIQTGINEPRYASLRGIRMAQRTDIEHVDLADIELDETALNGAVTRVSMDQPVAESTAEIFEGDASSTAAQLAAFLRDKGVGS